MKTTVLSIACLALSAMPIVAQAQTSEGEVEMQNRDLIVTYDDLDLSKRSNQRVLKNRLDRAARIACGYVEMRTGTRLGNSDAYRCYREARANARASFDTVMQQQGKGG